MINSNTLYYQ